MSLVDQFLEEDNEELNQFTASSATANQAETEDPVDAQQKRKQMLQEFKRKYNFYNESSDSSSDKEDQHEAASQNEGGEDQEGLEEEEEVKESEEEEEEYEEPVIEEARNQVQAQAAVKQVVPKRNKYSFSSSSSQESSEKKVIKRESPMKEQHSNQYQEDSDEDESVSYIEPKVKIDVPMPAQYNRLMMQSSQAENLSKYQRSEQNQEQARLIENQNIQEKLQKSKNHRDHDDDTESELDFYQLSDADTSNLLQSSNKKSKGARQGYQNHNDFNNDSEEEQQKSPKDEVKLKSSIAKVASLLDSQIQNYDKLINNQTQELKSGQKKPQSEMTFGDLVNTEDTNPSSGYPKFKPTESVQQLSQSQTRVPQQQAKPIHQDIIREEETDEEDQDNSVLEQKSSFSHSLNYSSLGTSQVQNMSSQLQSFSQGKSNQVKPVFKYEQQDQSTYRSQVQSQPCQVESTNKLLSLRILLSKKKNKDQQLAFQKFKDHNLTVFYQVKLKNAAQMVEKMSKFSRSFISLNSLSQILQKNKVRVNSKYFNKWVFNAFQSSDQSRKAVGKTGESQSQSQSQQESALVCELRQKLEQKDQEIARMEQMFKEYTSWKSKLEQIELKMKSEVDYWKQACERLQKENEKLQKEAMKISQSLMERQKEVESKNSLVEQLQKKLQKQAKEKAVLDPVEEAVCHNCKNSLEESQLFSGRLSRGGGLGHNNSKDSDQEKEDQQLSLQIIQELNIKMSDLEKQLMIYRERVHYHESIEEELKKNIEQQVDVVLKMEEERLLLLKESKEVKDKNKTLNFDNEEFRSKISIFETELEELQEQIRIQQADIKDKVKKEQQQQLLSDEDSDDQSVASSIKKQTNKENKNVANSKKKINTSTGPLSMTGLSKKSTALKKGLKFQTAQGKQVGENSAVFSSAMKQAQVIQREEEQSNKSKYGVEPVNKSLLNDNQLLTNELVSMGREISKLKAELRQTQEQMKKSEKEKYDCKKNLEGKETAVDKLRKERDELWAIVNTDKYKNIRNVEIEKEKLDKQKQELDLQLINLREQLATNSQDFKDHQGRLELRIQELEFTNGRLNEKDIAREKLLEVLEEKSRKFENELNLNDQLSQTSRKEIDALRQDNAKMKKDVDWLANSAKNNKIQAERAISDLESYTKILRGMEKKLAEVEIEKERKEQELRELRAKMSGAPQFSNQILGAQINPQIMQQLQAQQQQQMMNNQQNMGSQQQQMTNQHSISQQQQWHSQQQQQMAQYQQMSMGGNQNRFQQQQQQYPQQQQAPTVVSRQGLPQPQQPPQRFH